MSDTPTSPKGDDNEGRGIEELMAVKKAKIADMRSRGIDPFPSRTVRRNDCSSVRPLSVGLTEPMQHSTEKVAIAGRLTELRDMGKSIFGRLADLSGNAQVYFKKDALPEDVFALVKRDLAVGERHRRRQHERLPIDRTCGTVARR